MLDEDKVIDNLYSDFEGLISLLEKNSEISFQTEVSVFLSKILIVSIASLFEQKIKYLLIDYVEKQSNNNEPLKEFFKNKAIERRYHEYFDWKANNANKFFSSFGSDFENYIKNKLNEEINDSISAFMELGRLRNLLVHHNFATYNIDKTLVEVYNLYKKAKNFISFFNEKLMDANSAIKT